VALDCLYLDGRDLRALPLRERRGAQIAAVKVEAVERHAGRTPTSTPTLGSVTTGS